MSVGCFGCIPVSICINIEFDLLFTCISHSGLVTDLLLTVLCCFICFLSSSFSNMIY